ncbi:MAG: STAS domain-containing protein [Pseudoxanthomonas sp.]
MSTVSLGEDLGIEASAELKQKLAPYLDQAMPVVLDGSEVMRVHTASLQVLCAFVRSRHDAGHETELSACSDSLRNAARTLGLAQTLGLPSPEDDKKAAMENAA